MGFWAPVRLRRTSSVHITSKITFWAHRTVYTKRIQAAIGLLSWSDDYAELWSARASPAPVSNALSSSGSSIQAKKTYFCCFPRPFPNLSDAGDNKDDSCAILRAWSTEARYGRACCDLRRYRSFKRLSGHFLACLIIFASLFSVSHVASRSCRKMTLYCPRGDSTQLCEPRPVCTVSEALRSRFFGQNIDFENLRNITIVSILAHANRSAKRYILGRKSMSERATHPVNGNGVCVCLN